LHPSVPVFSRFAKGRIGRWAEKRVWSRAISRTRPIFAESVFVDIARVAG
jgi:hypothetical protein